MESKLRILLVEDDTNACQAIIKEVDGLYDDFTLIGITNNSEKALSYVNDANPDVVILDLELHQGSGSGIEFLKGLRAVNATNKPFVLVTTNNISSVAHSIARELGADFIMTKNQEGYSASTVINFIKIAKPIILENRLQTKAISDVGETKEQYLKRLNYRVCNEMDKIGINPKAVGCKYLIDAIILIIEEKTQNICGQIGNKYQKTPNSVERAMQNAINQTWVASDINVLLAQYTARIKSEKGVPTINEFIYFYARKIKNSL